MIAFPVYEQLKIDGYGLYPGRNKDHSLDINFGPGLTLILGANGLGKTTLITMLFRMLSGPMDLRSSGGDSLGTTSLSAVEIGRQRKREFAARVRDGAENAQATLVFVLGETRFSVTRNLNNLRMSSWTANLPDCDQINETSYQSAVCEAAGVHSFGDFLLLLRHLIFFFEDRRALVWDSAAQRQILRALFLSPEDAKTWFELERVALSLDSDLRNTSALMSRTERDTTTVQKKQANVSEVRVQIEAFNKLQTADTERQELLGQKAAELDTLLTRQRLDMLRAEQSADALKRQVERAQLSAIEHSYPELDVSMRYIFTQLMSDGLCRACGQESTSAVERLKQTLEAYHCVVCNQPLSGVSTLTPSELVVKRIEKSRDEAGKAQQQLLVAQRAYRDTAKEYGSVQQELAQLSDVIDQRHRELSSLYHQLPPEEADFRRQDDFLTALKGRLEALKSQLAAAQVEFSQFVANKTRAVHNFSEKLKLAFNKYAEGFLLEQVTLSWSPVQEQLGIYSENPYIEFPAFQLDVTGSDFTEPVRRDGPGQVSESQREFIDLAFRMALIEVAGYQGSGTLVIDAPESSLDAVFVNRAAEVLGRFALATKDNRLIVTSNILQGELLPDLVVSSTNEATIPQIIDLFEEGYPTAAIVKLEGEYKKYREALKDRLLTIQAGRIVG